MYKKAVLIFLIGLVVGGQAWAGMSPKGQIIPHSNKIVGVERRGTLMAPKASLPVSLQGCEGDTLYYDDGSFEDALGIYTTGLPDTVLCDTTIAFANIFSGPCTLKCVSIYFDYRTDRDFYLWVWDGLDHPNSDSAIYETCNVPSPDSGYEGWWTVDLSAENVVVPPAFWVGVGYSYLDSVPEWYLGFDTNTYNNYCDINLWGDPDHWMNLCDQYGYCYPFGIRAIVTGRPLFIRGDVDTLQGIGMADAIFILKCLYVPGSPCPSCDDAADADDDGDVGMADAIFILKCLYVPGEPCPDPPYPDCGPDPTPDDLGCCDHSCMHVAKTSLGKGEVDGEIIFGNATIQDQKVIVPVYLENNRSLSGFAYTVSYVTELLTFTSADNASLVTGNFDFFSARPDEESGSVNVGSLIDMGLKRSLTPGYNQVATLIFELKTNESQETVLKFTDVELVDTEAHPLSAHTNTCTIRIPFSMPKVFGLGQNYPNPVKNWTAIRYQLPKSAQTTLRIYNAAGQLLRTLVDEAKNPGYYSEVWNGKDNLGRKVSSGVYFYQLKTDEYTKARKLVVVQ